MLAAHVLSNPLSTSRYYAAAAISAASNACSVLLAGEVFDFAQMPFKTVPGPSNVYFPNRSGYTFSQVCIAARLDFQTRSLFRHSKKVTPVSPDQVRLASQVKGPGTGAGSSGLLSFLLFYKGTLLYGLTKIPTETKSP
jgi:hypothetical protein